MQKLPIVSSAIQILKVEVWVTNRNGSTTDTRDIVAFMDLGEINPYTVPTNGNTDPKPFNRANALYDMLLANPDARNSSRVQSVLTGPGFGLAPVQDFEKTFARKLLPSDYYFNPQIGFVSLNQPLQPDEVLAVVLEFVDRFVDIGQRLVLARLLETRIDCRPPATRSYVARSTCWHHTRWRRCWRTS